MIAIPSRSISPNMDWPITHMSKMDIKPQLHSQPQRVAVTGERVPVEAPFIWPWVNVKAKCIGVDPKDLISASLGRKLQQFSIVHVISP